MYNIHISRFVWNVSLLSLIIIRNIIYTIMFYDGDANFSHITRAFDRIVWDITKETYPAAKRLYHLVLYLSI